ncbi:MAG: fumarylacetoacetate hydrolase family protein [Spirochaetota bacterium]|nr:fumarylacetoacetate hydrolase family protein [Spirochaetota bacterium]
MKLVTFIPESSSTQRVGVVVDDRIIDLKAASEAQDDVPENAYNDMLSLICCMPRVLDQIRILIDRVLSSGPESVICQISKVQLLAPLPRPTSIRDFMAFPDHQANAMHTVAGWMFPPIKWLNGAWRSITGKGFLSPPKLWYEIPSYYKGNPLTVVGPEADIRWPSYEDKLDFELEFGIYISQEGRDIPKGRAREYIAGYTIFNDLSARKVQMKEMRLRLGPTKGKDFDTSNVMGPYLVTPDEIADPYKMGMTARVNGEEWSRGNSCQMYYTLEDIITYVSRDETLYPGEFFGSGTVPTGCGLELDRWIKPGDVIELEIEGLGVLRNRIVKV